MLLRMTFLCCFLPGFLSLNAQDKDSLVFKRYYYEEGAVSSEGYLRDGKPDGYWKSFYRNGNIKAEGNRKDYLLDGPWSFYSEEGEKTLEIHYREDKKNGLQKTFRNGRVVKEESFADDQRQGFTRIYYTEGGLHKEIPFVDGKEGGTGYEYARGDGRIITLFTYKNGVLTKQQQINRMDQQQQKQGMWMEFYSTRAVQQEGPYVNNLKNGYWKYYRSNGNLMRVEKWVMGVLQEDAEEVAMVEIKRELDPRTGKLAFKGAYRNGKPEGVHRRYDEEGNVIASKIYENGVVLYEGIVDEQGRKQGPWKEYYPGGGLKAEGSYENDLKVQEWRYYYPEGEMEQVGSYIRGLPDGIWTWSYENGQTRREEEFVMGQEEGPSVEYNDTGAVIARGQYIEGRKDGEWIYMVNDYKETGSYFDGLRNGNWQHFYLSNGQMRFEGNYENGLETGLHTYYYDNGQVERRGRYIAGEKDGIWEYFREDGVSVISIEYEGGKEIRYNGERIRYGRRLDKELEAEAGAEEEELQ